MFAKVGCHTFIHPTFSLQVMIAPFGTGVGMNPGKICEGAMELVGAVNTFAGPASGFHFAKQGWEIEPLGCWLRPVVHFGNAS